LMDHGPRLLHVSSNKAKSYPAVRLEAPEA
jgi:hypothetical protein